MENLNYIYRSYGRLSMLIEYSNDPDLRLVTLTTDMTISEHDKSIQLISAFAVAVVFIIAIAISIAFVFAVTIAIAVSVTAAVVVVMTIAISFSVAVFIAVYTSECKKNRVYHQAQHGR